MLNVSVTVARIIAICTVVMTSSVALAGKPTAPASLAASVADSSQINLSWQDKSKNETGFKIERAPNVNNAPGSWTNIATVGANVTGYYNTGLTLGTKYWYRVTAYNSSGNSAYTSQVSATTSTLSSVSISGFPNRVAGLGGNFNVKLLDSSSRVVTNYTGQVHFSSTDSGAVLPADGVVNAGNANYNAIFRTVKSGGHQLTVNLVSTPTVKATQSGIMISPAPVSRLEVSGYPSSIMAGSSGSVVVKAFDQFNNLVPNYGNIVIVSATDSEALIDEPSPYNFNVVFRVPGTHSILARDYNNASINGAQAGIQVLPTPAPTPAPTPQPTPPPVCSCPSLQAFQCHQTVFGTCGQVCGYGMGPGGSCNVMGSACGAPVFDECGHQCGTGMGFGPFPDPVNLCPNQPVVDACGHQNGWGTKPSVCPSSSSVCLGLPVTNDCGIQCGVGTANCGPNYNPPPPPPPPTPAPVCPPTGQFCPNQPVYDNYGQMCGMGTMQTSCPDPSSTCQGQTLYDSCNQPCGSGSLNCNPQPPPAVCPNPADYCEGEPIYDSNGQQCSSGTRNCNPQPVCPDPSQYCSDQSIYDSNGNYCGQGAMYCGGGGWDMDCGGMPCI